jgi:hypothetical protein
MLLAIPLMQVAAAWNIAYLPSRSTHRYLPAVSYQSSSSSAAAAGATTPSSSWRMSAMSSSFHNDIKTSTKHQQFEVGSPVVLTTRRNILLNLHVVVAASMVGVGGWIIRTSSSSDDDRIDDIRANALDMDAFVNAQVTKKICGNYIIYITGPGIPFVLFF